MMSLLQVIAVISVICLSHMVRADSVSDYTNSPLGIPSLYHAEKAYCGGGSEDFIDMNYDTNQYTQVRY